MSRDLSKAIAEYQQRYLRTNSTEGAFYGDDIQQIKELAGTGKDAVYDAAFYALMAGFMIGYRKAQRDSRKKRAAAGAA